MNTTMNMNMDMNMNQKKNLKVLTICSSNTMLHNPFSIQILDIPDFNGQNRIVD